MPRPYLYHVWHRTSFDALPAWSSKTITGPRTSGTGTETKKVYSLKKDMEQLRADGKAKGIVDDSVVSVGKSLNGKELWALKVGKGSTHKVLITGCHHAREWISVEVAYLVAEYLIQNYTATPSNDKEKRIKHLLMNREILFIPMVNPDGHEYTTTVDRRWRPVRKAYNLPAKTFVAPKLGGGSRSIPYPAAVYTGVDMNRNYATTTWGQETFNSGYATTSRDPRDSGANSVWCGPSGSSETETKIIDDLIRKGKFRASLTYHSFSQLLLYPDAAASDAFVQDVGKGMEELINQYGNAYRYLAGSAMYPTTGDMTDLAYEQAKGRPTYTPELRPGESAARSRWFSGLPEREIGPCFEENLAAALALINCAGHDSIPSKISCSIKLTMPPLVCTVVRNCWDVFKGWTP
jgi:carboxypeptidase T